METAVKELLDILNSLDSIKCQSHLNILESSVSNYTKFLPQPITIESYNEINQSSIDGFLYGRIVAGVVHLIDHDRSLHGEIIENLIKKLLVVDGSTFEMLHELLEALDDSLKKMTNDKTINFIMIILEELIKSDAIYSAIIHSCKSNVMNAIENEDLLQNWRKFLQILVSLPNRIANKMKGQISDSFTLDIYPKIITYHIVRAISFLNDASHKYSVKFKTKIISTMISKTVLTLGAHKFLELIEILINWSLNKQKNIQSLIKNILLEIDSPSIEPIAVLILKIIKTPSNVHEIFHDLLNINSWNYVLLTKIPLLSYYNDELLIINLISYLAHPQNDKCMLIDLLIRLLDIWGDRSALNHTSLDQHEYITKLILLSVKTLSTKLKQIDKDNIQRLLFDGTSAHLESMQVEVRAIGMITGELIVEYLSESSDVPKLIYEYDSMPMAGVQIVERLKTFIKDSDGKNLINDDKTLLNVGDEEVYQLGIKCGILSDNNENYSEINNEVHVKNENIEEIKFNNENVPGNDEDNFSEELDSDDDLIPYDMSNDIKITDKLRPIYLRDLKENLLNVGQNKNPDIFSESLKAAEELILSQLPNDDSSLAIELLEILTTLKEHVYTENFELLKFKSCVAIATVYPKQSAKYLCGEFHAQIGQHSVSDRMFFLDILAEASKQLSKIKIETNVKKENKTDSGQIAKLKRPKKPISIFIDISGGKKYETLYDEDFEVSTTDHNSEKSNWEEIVERRIQTKTRIFAHESKRPQITINKFNDVASSFFYPLLYGLSQKSACLYKIPISYEDQENILLIHFLKTLSTIMVSSENCVVAPKIGLDILELAWTLRYHEQAKVRLCVIQNIASVIVSLSKETFTTEIIELLLEFRTWLIDVSQDSIRGDPDKDCRNLGSQVVALIDLTINSTINK